IALSDEHGGSCAFWERSGLELDLSVADDTRSDDHGWILAGSTLRPTDPELTCAHHQLRRAKRARANGARPVQRVVRRKAVALEPWANAATHVPKPEHFDLLWLAREPVVEKLTNATQANSPNTRKLRISYAAAD
ncbi:MAG: hypothetical protein ACREA0_30610, partial [bacterium]